MTRQHMADKMRKGWNSNETPCGSGSEIRNTERVRSALVEIVEEYGIKSISDAGAGDRRWIKRLDLPVRYQGFDLVVRNKEVTQFDITQQILPTADLILCRHVLNHLSVKFAIDALDNFVASGSRYLLMTNCDNQVQYWQQFGVSMLEPIRTWTDVQKWRLELYDIEGTDADSLYQMG